MGLDRALLVEFLRVYPFQPATAWWRAFEVAHLLRQPIPAGLCLDVGCGDGLLTEIIVSHVAPAARTWVGVDPDPAEAALARQRGLYTEALVTTADRIDWPAGQFDFALSNSVLEHIPGVEGVLQEVARVLKPGAPFVITVPSARFHDCLRGPSVLRRLLLRQGRAQYLEQIDRRLAHRNYWDEEQWRRALSAAGFTDLEFSSYFAAAEAQRWETVSNLTAGLLYELMGHRPPIEIQRSLGMRRSYVMPDWTARWLAGLLSAGVRADDTGLWGGLMMVARNHALGV
jgi:SAM-dependent methyltransferase